MSDDDASFRRRRRRDGDLTPASGETPSVNDESEPEPDDEGADWLLSQLEDDDTERTQAIPIADAPEQLPSRRSEEPVPDLTPWWRNADSGAPVADTADRVADAGLDATDDAVPEADAEPEPRRRSTFQAFTPALPDDDAVEPEPEPAPEPEPELEPAPEPAREPEPEPFAEPAVEFAPAPAPQPVVDPDAAPVEAPASAVTADPEDAPTPPLFKRRPDSDRPSVTRPVDGHSDSGPVDLPTAIPSQAPNSENSTGEVDLNDSAPFVWSLTPNDQLDPIVHKTTSTSTASDAASRAHGAEPKAAEASPVVDPDASVEPTFLPTPAFVPESTTPPVGTETVVIPEIIDEGTDENESTDLDETVDDDIVDAEIVEGEPEDDEADEPVSAHSSVTHPTATFNTEDVDSLAFLMGLEEATAATVASQSVVNDQDDLPADNAPSETAPSEDADVAEPLTRRRAAALASSDDEAPTAVFPPVGPFPEDPAPDAAATGSSERPPLPPYVKWIALGVVALLVLVGLFLLGTRLPSLFGAPAAAPSPSPTATPTPSATPTPTEPPAAVVTVGPVAPGEHKWTELLGSECLEPYSTPWAENFTVVDCATPHRAQMVFTAPVTSDPAAPYPGESEIASQIALWCSAPGVFDTAAAGGFTDLQVQGTYPVSDEQWADGVRNYYCFLSRSTGEPLTGTLAVAQPAT